MSGECLELDVPPESDILDLKRSVEGGGEWHVPANCQQMLQADNALTARTTLQDEERIAALGTEDSAIVSLTMMVSLEKVFCELGSNNPDCRIDALQQLCKFGLQTDAHVVGAVINHILDNENDGANVRTEAVKALGQITRKDNQLAINAVLACLRDGHAQTRDNAVGALAKIVENGQLEALDFESDFLSAKLDSNSFTLKARRLYDITLDAFAKGLAHLTNLTVLRLNLYECYQLKSVDELGKGLANLTRLTELKLDFMSAGVSSVVEVGKGLAELRALTNLKLNFSYCYELTSVDEVGKGLADLTNLRELNFNFARCPGLATVDEVGKGIAELHNLTTLSLDLSGHCDYGSAITSVDEVGKGLSHLTNLTTLALNFEDCDGLTSVAEVGNGLADLHCLTSLDLNFCCGCCSLATIDASGERLAGRELVDISELWQSLPWK